MATTASATFDALTVTRISSTKWSLTNDLVVVDNLGNPAVSLEVEFNVTTSGSWGTSSTSVGVVTDAAGRAPFALGPFNRSGTRKVSVVTVTVTGMTSADGTLTWDGQATSFTATAP